MRQYELMVVLRPDFPLDKEQEREKVIAKLAGEGVTVKTTTLLGKKQLAYPIKKHNDGVYVLAALEAPAIIVGDIEKRTRQDTDVLRYLLIAK